MDLLEIFLIIEPKGSYKDFAKWYKGLTTVDKIMYRYNLSIIKELNR